MGEVVGFIPRSELERIGIKTYSMKKGLTN
jgi:hypothetical protein